MQSVAENRKIAELTSKINSQQHQIKSLSESVNKYKNLFTISNNAIFHVDLKGVILEVNDVACKIYGYNTKEFLSLSFFDLLSKNNRKKFEKYFYEFAPSQSAVQETIQITKKGKRIPVELITQIFELNGKISILIIAKDISNRIKHEKQLEIEKDLLKTLMDNIPDTIYFKDKDSKFTRINNAQAKLLGIANCDEAIGATDFDFFDSKHAEAAFRDEKQLFKTKKSIIAKAEHIRMANGNSKWVSATKVPVLDKKGNVSGLVGISRDISDLKNAENKIQKYAKELQYLNASKDKFFSIVAHDLKNPFFALIGFEEMLANNFDQLSDEEKKEYIKNIIKISKNSYMLLENLLQWAKTQTGRIEIRPQEIDLKTLLDENTEFFIPIAQKKDIHIENTLKKSVFVYADPDMMRTVIRNLLTNAIKFTEDGGLVQIQVADAKSHYKIIVNDSGRGMDKETITNLFKIDFNHNSVGTRNEVGTGLGLIICKEFIEKNNGHISAESKPGKGSKFMFTIPKHSL